MSSTFAARFNDDVFSPMLIKELRQGMKSKSFMFAFLLVQALMVFFVLMLASALEANRNPEGFDRMFWFFLGATLIVVMPLRAFGALTQEYKANTLELIFLTRLSAWRIIAGKWLALFSQSVLLATATLPYLLLRYFMGGVNISDDLQIAFWLLVASAGLTALGVCFSAFRAQWIRVVVIVAMFMAPYFGAIFMFRTSMGAGGPSPVSLLPHPFLATLLNLTASALGVMLALYWGASRIAPPAENYSRWKRGLTLALLAIAPALVFATGQKSVIVVWPLIMLVALCMDALGEQPRFIPSIYAAFVRRGLLTRIAGRFLYPGWPSGVLFTLVATGVYVAMMYAYGFTTDDHVRGMTSALPGTLLFPLAVILAIRPGMKNIMAGYLGVLIACIILTVVGLSIHGALSHVSLLPLSLLPPSAFILHMIQEGDDPSWIPVTAAVSLLALFVLFLRMRPVTARMLELERAAMNDVRPQDPRTMP